MLDIDNVSGIVSQNMEKLKDVQYILADTRVKNVSLYDHLRVTAGISVVLIKELLNRGVKPLEIAESDINERELLTLAWAAGWLHDWGKIEGYKNHIERSVEFAKNILSASLDENLLNILLKAIERHHINRKPESMFEKAICLADSYASAGDRPGLTKVKDFRDLVEITSSTIDIERELFGKQKPITLLLGDVDSIKNYVFESSSLPDIRGGSGILMEIEDFIKKYEFKKSLAEEAIIYIGGGGFLAIVPTSQAEWWENRIKEIYLEKTKVVTISIAKSEPIGYLEFMKGLPPWDEESLNKLEPKGIAKELFTNHFDPNFSHVNKGFGELVNDIGARLKRVKREKENSPFYPLIPIIDKCEACGIRPVTYYNKKKAEKLCEICRYKRDKGREERHLLVNDFVNWIVEKKEIEIFKEELVLKSPEDLDKLAGGDGRIGIIYADGNNMGSLFQKCKSPAEYRHLSDTLHKAVRDSVYGALWKTFGERFVKSNENLPFNKLPFEIVLIGGDDVLLIVRAIYGWPISLKILGNFKEHPKVKQLSEELDTKLSLSLSLLITDVKYPIQFSCELAEKMLKLAKQKAYKENGNTIYHFWLRTPRISLDPVELHDNTFKREDKKDIELTARPYTLVQAIKLQQIASNLHRTLPKAQLRQLAESLNMGVQVSINWALYQAQRLPGKEQKNQYLESLRALGELISNDSNDGMLFWRNIEDTWKTSLLDAIELIELGIFEEEIP